MHTRDTLLRERLAFLGQEPAKLRTHRGRALYETLEGLGLTHEQYFRALGVEPAEYCAQEFGIDLGRITVERFFHSDPDARWLFPDIVREAVLAGMKRKPLYPELIARDERISGAAYDVPYVKEDPAEEELRGVAEGGAIPESEIAHGSRIVRLDKRGRGVIASYEVIRRMSVDLLRTHLQRIGEQLGRALDARLAAVLVQGDNSGETAAEALPTGTAGAWAYEDLVKGVLTLSIGHYFTPTHLIAGPEALLAILNLPELKDAARFDFHQTGALPAPLGLKIAPIPEQPAHRVTLLDAGYAVQKLTEQDLLVESDKLIQQQWDRTYLTVVTDFAILYDKARVVLNSDWS